MRFSCKILTCGVSIGPLRSTVLIVAQRQSESDQPSFGIALRGASALAHIGSSAMSMSAVFDQKLVCCLTRTRREGRCRKQDNHQCLPRTIRPDIRTAEGVKFVALLIIQE